MEFINRLSQKKTIDQMIEDLTKALSGPYDLGILFVSYLTPENIRQLVDGIRNRISIKNFVGCTSAGVIGTQQEVEQQPAASIILAKLPQVNIVSFSLNQSQLENLETNKDWYQFFEVFPNEHPVFLSFPDPFSIDVDKFLLAINSSYPRCPVIGGLASGGSGPNENLLIAENEYYHDGMVGFVLTGNLSMETVVSQGCRPVGQTYIVTKAEGNIIYELAGKPFLHVLQGILDKASARDKLLAQEAIFVGLVIDEYKHTLKRGDFLIRTLMGIDQSTGAGAIGGYAKIGQTVQFHLRDALTAADDLNELLEQQVHRHNEKPKGALVFSCNGRGMNLFREKNHDIAIIQNHLGPIPAVGFFCAGELGPIGGNNFLHGFTDSIALFYPKHIN